MTQKLPDTIVTFDAGGGDERMLHSLPALEEAGIGKISRLPVCLRVVLESVLRNLDGKTVTGEHVRDLANWSPGGARQSEIPFKVARIILQDFTGVPLLADLAAMRDAAVEAKGSSAGIVEPLVPVDLVVDHSVQVDYYGSHEAQRLNLQREFERNGERYRFLKWGAEAFKTFKVVPPGVGIVHQVNLEHLAAGVMQKGKICYPDTLVGTDSHTTMINGIGVVGWGVGGIEAEAAMLGQPINLLTPDVVGVHLRGSLREGRTATDLVLRITELLRSEDVVGKFVEFFGEGAAALPVPDRATIGNMAPEYGATMGYFPADEMTLEYYAMTGREPGHVSLIRSYLKAQGMFGIPRHGQCDYSRVIELDLTGVSQSVAGPKRPQDRISLPDLGGDFRDLLGKSTDKGGFGRRSEQISARHKVGANGFDIGDGDVLIAAITSCTNTSNPSVLVAAGLLARNAVACGLKVHPRVKTSLAPGSRVVTDYLSESGLLKDLEALGFNVVGYGCTTCIGNSGPLDPAIDSTVTDNDVVAASVLSGNRNFEARIHPSIKANFLMSPPLVVAFALAGTVCIDLDSEPLGQGRDGEIYLRDLWPTLAEIEECEKFARKTGNYQRRYGGGDGEPELWREIDSGGGARYSWDESSTYIRKPPFFELDEANAKIENARPLAILGDSITTDHISPAGAIQERSPAGVYLRDNKVRLFDFNSYGSRRGNHEVMIRGTFANVRIRNLMVPGSEGGVTAHQPSGEVMPIFDAAMRYGRQGVPLVVIAGKEYGAGSSRDWAAKGTRLLGVRAVVAESYERIHRSNLVGMGVLPLQFQDSCNAATLGLDGSETFTVTGIGPRPRARQEATLTVTSADGTSREVPLLVRIDTATEADIFETGGILPHVLDLLAGERAAA